MTTDDFYFSISLIKEVIAVLKLVIFMFVKLGLGFIILYQKNRTHVAQEKFFSFYREHFVSNILETSCFFLYIKPFFNMISLYYATTINGDN